MSLSTKWITPWQHGDFSSERKIKQSDVSQIVPACTPSQISNPSRQREAEESNNFVINVFMKQSKDGSICVIKTRVISSWANSSSRDQLCQANNENQAVLFSFLWIDGRFSSDDERFEDIKCILKEQEEGWTPDSVTGVTPQAEKIGFLSGVFNIFIYLFLEYCYPTGTFTTFKYELIISSCFQL